MSEGKDRVKAAPQEDNDRTGIIAAGAEAQSFLSPSPTNQIEGRDRRPTPTGTPHQRTGDSRSGSGLGCHHRRRPCQDDWLHHLTTHMAGANRQHPLPRRSPESQHERVSPCNHSASTQRGRPPSATHEQRGKGPYRHHEGLCHGSYDWWRR